MSALTRSQDKLAEVREELEEYQRLCSLDGLKAQAYVVHEARRIVQAAIDALRACQERRSIDENKPIEF